MDKRKRLDIDRSMMWLICKTIIVLVVTKRSIKYLMIPNTSLSYWMIAGILIYLWNCSQFGKVKKKFITFIGAILLSISIFSAYLVRNEFNINCAKLIGIIDFVLTICFSWILLNVIFMFFDWISVRKSWKDLDIKQTGIGNWKKFICVFIFIFLMWLPYFLTWYPGLIFGDSLNSIYQALGLQEWSNHFPVLYSLFIKVCLYPGIMFGDLNIGYAIYTLIQMIFIAGVLAYIVCWLKYKNFTLLSVVSCLYYAFEPCFPQHAIAMWKDGIFSVALLYLCIQLFDLVISNGEIIKDRFWRLGSIAVTCIVCFFRNNGVYVIILVCVCIGVYTYIHKDNYNKKIKYIFYQCMVVLVTILVTGFVYPVFGIDDDEVEKYGIVLQQMAKTVTGGGYIDEDEYIFLNELLPIERYSEVYRPWSVDSIKWDENFNNNFLEENQGELIHVWFKLFMKNPKIYIKAYLEMTYQYWSPNVWENNKCENNIIWGNIDGAVTNPWWEQAEVRYCNILENKWFDTKKVFSITTPMISVGLLVWLMILVILYAINKNCTALILPFVPCIGVLLTLLLATPSGYWPRYMLIIYYLLPVFMGTIFIIAKTES